MRPRKLVTFFPLMILALVACDPGKLPPAPSSVTSTVATDTTVRSAQVFVPLVADSPVSTATMQTPFSPLPTNTPVPFIHLGEGEPRELLSFPFPPPIYAPDPYFDTHGATIVIAGKEIQLPDDTFIETMGWPYRPPSWDDLWGNVFMSVRRGDYRVGLIGNSGQIFVESPTAQTRAEAIQAFDFLIQVLGIENIMPPDESCADCLAQASPLPTPTP